MSFEEAKETGYGVAKKPESDHPLAPKLKGWVKVNGEMMNFTLWASKKERGAFNIQLHESLKKGARDGEVKDNRPRPTPPPAPAAQTRQEFPDPFDSVDF